MALPAFATIAAMMGESPLWATGVSTAGSALTGLLGANAVAGANAAGLLDKPEEALGDWWRRQLAERGGLFPNREALFGRASSPSEAAVPSADAFGPANYDPTRVLANGTALASQINNARRNTPAAFPAAPRAPQGVDLHQLETAANTLAQEKRNQLDQEAALRILAAKEMPMPDQEKFLRGEQERLRGIQPRTGMELLRTGDLTPLIGPSLAMITGKKDFATVVDEGIKGLHAKEKDDVATKRALESGFLKDILAAKGIDIAALSAKQAKQLEADILKTQGRVLGPQATLDVRKTQATQAHDLDKIAAQGRNQIAAARAGAEGRSLSQQAKDYADAMRGAGDKRESAVLMQEFLRKAKTEKPEMSPLQKALMEDWGKRAAAEGITMSPWDMQNFAAGKAPIRVEKDKNGVSRFVWE